SACGGNSYPESEETAPISCSPFLAPDGEVKPQRSPNFYRYHYPIIMTKEGHVSQLSRGLLNVDFITTKTETLVFFDKNGNVSNQLPQKFEGAKSLNVKNASSHLSDIVGDYFGLREQPLADTFDNSGTLTQEDFQKNLVAISSSFEKSLAYPIYSSPLSTRDHALLNQNESNTIHRFYDNKAYSAGIILPQYLMFRESVVPVTFKLKKMHDKTLPEIEYVKGEIIDQEGTVTNEFELRMDASNSLEKLYKIELQPKETEYSKWSSEVNLKISFKPKGKNEETIAKMFKYIPSIASIVGKGQTQVDGSNLIIPLDLEVKQPGDYIITCNLFSKETGKPIAHLIGEESIKEYSGTVLLKVHSTILKEKNEMGPYLIRDITIARIPDNFGEQRQFGDPGRQQYEIDRVEFSQYLDEEIVISEFEKAKSKRFQQLVDSLVRE
ncbi:hypothetical protein KKA14_14510, partial [bacterium]|nr:hypothetical protein [bacterium]